MKDLLLSLCSILSFFLCSAQINTAKLDSLFNTLDSNNKAMGSVAISKSGKLIYARAIGGRLINGNKRINATTDTKYRIGSITKMFTGVMIFQLMEEKKLSADTKLDKYFPSVPNAGKITIGQMLGHRSGIYNFTNDENYLTWNTKAKTEKEMVELIAAKTPAFEPGAKAEYSNSNFVLLGYIIEKVTGKTYATNLEQRIFSRAGLKNTAIGTKTRPEKNESYSYQFAGSWEQQPETDMSVPGGAGNLISTPADLVKFAEALFANMLLSAKSLGQMMDIQDDYGMALFRFPFYDKWGYGHTGGIDGFSSMLAFFPSDSLSIAYISNGQVYPMNDILIGVLSIYFNKPYKIPAFTRDSLQHTAEELDRLTGVYSSSQIPLKITISRKNLQLIALATGQSAFALETAAKNKFRFEQAGLEMEFFPDKKELILRQGGGSFTFTREN